MADGRLRVISRAAANNAALCDAVCRSHGIAGRFDADAWVSPTRTPPRYPDAVTLTPAVDRDGLVDRVDGGVGCSVKDSFAVLDLSRIRGWSVLFEATWLALDPTVVPPGARPEPTLRCGPIDDAEGLAAWAGAWSGGDPEPSPWRSEVLGQDLVVLAGRRGDTVVGGAVVNVAADVVGISNVFATERDTDPWAGALAWIAEHLPARPVVGYESGADLAAALDHGFEPVGPLRVWRRDAG